MGWRGQAIVYGRACTKGSVKAFVPKGGRYPVVRNDNPRSAGWQQDMSMAMLACRPDEPIVGPVEVTLTIYLQRPNSHYGTGKNAQKLKSNAPAYPTTTPDLDKVLRLACDAGTGVWWRDDSHVVREHGEKLYATADIPPQTIVTAREILLSEQRAYIENGA